MEIGNEVADVARMNAVVVSEGLLRGWGRVLSVLYSLCGESTFGVGGFMADTWGGEMTITLSASSAISYRFFPEMDGASIYQADVGR